MQILRIEASGMPNVEFMGRNDPYVTIKSNTNQWSRSTSVLDNEEENVCWDLANEKNNWTINIKKEELSAMSFYISAFDKNKMMTDTIIGSGDLPLGELLLWSTEDEQELRVELSSKKYDFAGTVTLFVKLFAGEYKSSNNEQNSKYGDLSAMSTPFANMVR